MEGEYRVTTPSPTEQSHYEPPMSAFLFALLIRWISSRFPKSESCTSMFASLFAVDTAFKLSRTFDSGSAISVSLVSTLTESAILVNNVVEFGALTYTLLDL